MGCASSNAIDRGEEDIVGGVGRTTQQVKRDEVPEEREPMVALEVAASRKTMYRKKLRKFKPSGDLDYQSNHAYCHLRNLLDEPVGKFYLREFAQEKKLPEMTTLLELWVSIHALRAQKDLSLEAVMKQAELEDQIKEGEDNAGDGGDDEAAGEYSITDDTHLYGYTISYMSDEEVTEKAKFIVETFLSPSGKMYCVPLLDESLVSETLAKVEETLEANDANALRQSAFREVENKAFVEIVNNGFHSKFREHSEYKRYKMKYAKVYNTISHRDFDFMATLGKGSFGRVIRVRKKTTGEQYALKVMSKKKILSGAESAEQVTIERNVVVMCSSPSIVKPAFTFQTSRALFLALELLEGGTLLDAIKANNGNMSVQATRFISAQIILGLEHLHKHGVLYRDLKPVNVMLDTAGNAILTDMGLCAKFRDSQFPKEQGGLSNSGHRLVKRKSMAVLKPSELKCVGTYGFRAPEILSVSETKAGYGPPVDYWALGVTVHYLLYSKLPFSKKAGRKSLLGAQMNPKEQEKRLHKEALALDKNMDANTRSFIEGLLDHDPEERLGTDLEKLHSHLFFDGLDWEKLNNRELKPVYVPPGVPKRTRSERPTFDGLASAMSQFSNDNVLELFGGENEMQDEYTHVGRQQQKLFRDWDYLPDSTLSSDWKLAKEDVLFD